MMNLKLDVNTYPEYCTEGGGSQTYTTGVIPCLFKIDNACTVSCRLPSPVIRMTRL